MNRNGAPSWGRSPAAAFVDDGERVVVLALDSLDRLGARLLIEPAATIWRAVDQTGSERDIITSVADAFALPPAEVELHVRAFLADLEAQGLLVRH